MNNYVETIGYGGPEPLVIIFWYKDDEPYCKTICYDEQDVINAYNRSSVIGDLYNTLRPSLQIVRDSYAEVK